MTAPTPRAGSPVALYVHVPFCVSVCPYCDFVVLAGSAARGPRKRIAPFVDAVVTELELRADELDDGTARPALRSLYLGGGTPSLLPADSIARIIDTARARFGLAPDAEITIEANPGSDERGDAVAFRDAGVTRFSIGAQSLDAVELRRLGRRHAPADIAGAVADARAAGIGSISLDLVYDIPGGSLETWGSTLDAALELGPDHLSLYALTLDDPDAEGLTGPTGDHLPTSRGARRWRAQARTDQDDDRAAAMYELADRRLRDAGYDWYELSNWARPGHRSRHNLAYWLREPYEAVGPGAHAFDGRLRRWNAARLDGYIAALAPIAGPPRLPPGGSEVVDAAIAASERAILGLRTSRGISSTDAARPPVRDVLPWAIDVGLLEATGDRYALTLRGRLLSNELFARLV
ncbi:MAG TPA: coproporphyrinogen-III oxidase family protein [Candidatus Limnocylindrales bacterium]|nr:coproporphyrinogen-III oxidase family protein [Candidatus Limnocylindrales bacterium]